MDKTTEALLLLPPVAFHYKTDSKDAPQFGLIAEEVAKVNSALVLCDKEGKKESENFSNQIGEVPRFYFRRISN